MIRKAEQNEERRRKNQKLRKEQQAAAQQSIREGKGAKAKREDKRNEAREIREAQRRTGKEIPEGIIRLSLTKNSNSVIWYVQPQTCLSVVSRCSNRSLRPGIETSIYQKD